MDFNTYDLPPVGARDGPAAQTAGPRRTVRPVLDAKQAVEGGASRASDAPAPERLTGAIQRVNETVESLLGVDKRLRFRVDDATGTVIATLTDGKTEEIVRQIPSEDFLDVAARLRELGSLLLDRVG